MSAPALMGAVTAFCEIRVLRCLGDSAVISAMVSSNKKLRKTCKRSLADWLLLVNIDNFPMPEGASFLPVGRKRGRDDLIPAADSIKCTSFKWTVAPGLFAGGVVDVMTLAMIKCLDRPRERSRNLDFACGSGIIAKWLLLAQPECRVTMCDNDTVALESAKVNNPSAEAVLSDSWRAASDCPSFGDCSRAFDNIYSNPPLHRGVAAAALCCECALTFCRATGRFCSFARSLCWCNRAACAGGLTLYRGSGADSRGGVFENGQAQVCTSAGQYYK
jgi:16S rRNA G1207 methylase RsmC